MVNSIDKLNTSRSDAKRIFTRRYNLLNKQIGSRESIPLQVLEKSYSELDEAYIALERAHDRLLLAMAEAGISNDDVNESDSYIVEPLDLKYDLYSKLMVLREKFESDKLSEASGGTDRDGSGRPRPPKVKAVDPPKFNGDICSYGTFKSDYSTLMVPQYGESAYILRECLTGEALNVIKGVEDSFDKMMERLDKRYGDKKKVTEAIVNKVRKLRPIPNDDSKYLIEFVDTIEWAVLELGKNGLTEIDSLYMASSIEERLNDKIKTKWAEVVQENLLATDENFLNELVKFLIKQKEVALYLSSELRSGEKGKASIHSLKVEELKCEANEEIGKFNLILDSLNNLTKIISNSNTTKKPPNNSFKRCIFHKRNGHPTAICWDFKKMDVMEQIKFLKDNNACLACFSQEHPTKECDRTVCDKMSNGTQCGQRHHPSFHDIFMTKPEMKVTSLNLNSKANILMMISSIRAKDKEVTTFWDPGANASLISHKMAQGLGLKGRDVMIDVERAGGNIEYDFLTKEYTVPLIDLHGHKIEIKTFGMDMVSSPAPKVNMSKIGEIFPQLNGFGCSRPDGEIHLLIGLDYSWLLPELVVGVGNLQLRGNRFGYVICGEHPLIHVEGERNHRLYTINIKNKNYVGEMYEVENNVKAFIESDTLGIDSNPKCAGCKCGNCTLGGKHYSLKEEAELQLINDGLTYDEKNQIWTVKYPWIKDPSTLPNNYSLAMSRLKALESKLKKRGPEYCAAYHSQINDMLIRNVARILSAEEINNYCGPVFFLPHTDIAKPESESTPLRIVFDPSHSYKGVCINDYWAKGPDVLNNLIGVLLRFREGYVAMACDIAKMYNSVKMYCKDQQCHRFLWREFDSTRTPSQYALTCVPFGDRPSACIAMLALKRTALNMKEEHPKASEAIDRNSYVDDILPSAENIEDATDMMIDVQNITKTGGFAVKEWIVSGTQTPYPEELNVVSKVEKKILGVKWLPTKDLFMFTFEKIAEQATSINKDNELMTRRKFLSIVATLFSPMGLIAPIILEGKLLMRKLITEYRNENLKVLNWDEPLALQVLNQCMNYLFKISHMTIPFTRCLKPSAAIGQPTLVIFSDASKESYGAAAYVRWQIEDSNFESFLVMAKSKLSPLKVIVIPRLELNGAVIGARIREFIVREMNFTFEKVYHLTDSGIVQAQIQAESHHFQPFTAVRIGEIQNKTQKDEWFWIPGDVNVADMVTRTDYTIESLTNIWQKGPEFLSKPVDEWPIKRNLTTEIPDKIVRYKINKCEINEAPILQLRNFKGFRFMINVLCRCKQAFKRKTFLAIRETPNPNDMAEVEELVIKLVQKQLPKDWERQYAKLGVFMNDSGVICVGQRIPQWMKKDYDKQQFVLLPTTHPVTQNIVEEVHNRGHLGVDACIAKLQCKFWVPGARKLIRTVRSKCSTCRKADKRLAGQVMGMLPPERIHPTPPFMHTALDIFGPIMVRDTVKKRSKGKAYGVIFNCFVTRAIHIELMDGYDTTAFLHAFRRFSAVRGYPSYVYSDLGSQLQASSREIQSLMKEVTVGSVQEFASTHGTEFRWDFTQSADSPWQNGLSEALIKSVKRCLTIAIGESVLTFSELQTTLYEVSDLLNERPIGIKPGTEPSLGKYLCPNDILLGRTLNRPPHGQFLDEETAVKLSKRMKFNQDIIRTFFKRWRRDYFPTLIIRQKWHTAKRDPQVGDVVLVQDNNVVRDLWKLGQISEVKKGVDNRVRDVTVRYKNTKPGPEYQKEPDVFIKRSVHKIVIVMPVEEQT